MKNAVVKAVRLTVLLLCIWLGLRTLVQLRLSSLASRRDHFAGILSQDVYLLTDAGNTNHPPIILPRGMSVYVAEGNDYGVTSLDDANLYKVYIHLTPETINRMTQFSRRGNANPIYTNQIFKILEEPDHLH